MRAIKKEFARGLRKNQTEAEKVVWELVRDRRFLGLKFRRQHVLYGFVVDFFCYEYQFAIEIDGGIHDKQKDYDQAREEVLMSKGISVLRIKNWQVFRNRNLILSKIKKCIQQHLSKKLPSPPRRGTIVGEPAKNEL